MCMAGCESKQTAIIIIIEQLYSIDGEIYIIKLYMSLS